MANVIFITVIFCCLTVLKSWRAEAHPQCLDFLPPFIPSQLQYCTEYASFGCCSRGDEIRVQANVSSMQTRISRAPNAQRCGAIVKEISCAQCSPYASHIFNAEATGAATPIPGLCRGFCLDAVAHCGMSVMQTLSQTENRTFANVSDFCAALAPLDVDYCLPEVRNFTSRTYPQASTTPGRLDCICAREVMGGLRNPVLAIHAGDGSHRLFVGEQLGIIRILLPNGTIPTTPFADLQDIVVTSGIRGDERGLIGMAFHPNYPTNGYVFFHLNVAMNRLGQRGLYNRVLRFTVDANDKNKIDRSTSKTIIEVLQPYGNHNGGEIFFGVDDGYLYIFLGDGGGAGDPLKSGLDRQTLLGSALRIDVNTPDNIPYAIPPSNPFYSATPTPAVRQEIYAYGLRNPWRCSQDIGDREANFTGKGRIFCGDVGQGSFEEIDLITSGGNYGWRAWEGTMCFNAAECLQQTDTIFPIYEYPHSVGKSVTGGYMYRGCLSPNLRNLYIFGDFVSGKVYGLKEVNSSHVWNGTELCFGDGSICNNGLTDISSTPYILSFGQDESGEVYILTTAFPSATNTGGKVYWLVDPARRGSPSRCQEYFPSAENASNIPVHFKFSRPGEVDFGGTAMTTTAVSAGARQCTSLNIAFALVLFYCLCWML